MHRTHDTVEVIVLTIFITLGAILLGAAAYLRNTGFLLAGLSIIILAVYLERGTRKRGDNHQ